MCFIIIPEGFFTIKERLGKFEDVLKPGIHLYFPIIDTFRNVSWKFNSSVPNHKNSELTGYLIPTSELIYDPEPIVCITKDKLSIDVDCIVYYKIIDIKSAIYNVYDLYSSMEQTILCNLHDTVSRFTYDELLRVDKKIISQGVFEKIDISMKSWGLGIIKLEIQKFTSSEEIKNATEQIAAEKRKCEQEIEIQHKRRHAQTLELQRNIDFKKMKINAVLEESKIKKMIQIMEIESLELRKKALGIDFMIAEKFAESLQILANSNSTTIFIPNDLLNFQAFRYSNNKIDQVLTCQ